MPPEDQTPQPDRPAFTVVPPSTPEPETPPETPTIDPPAATPTPPVAEPPAPETPAGPVEREIEVDAETVAELLEYDRQRREAQERLEAFWKGLGKGLKFDPKHVVGIKNQREPFTIVLRES